MGESVIEIAELKSLLVAALKHRNLSDQDCQIVADEYIEAELEGRRSHGIGKFLTIDEAIQHRGTQIVTNDNGPTAAIDGQCELGILVAHKSVELAISKANKFGIGLVVANNFARYGRLKPYVKMMAEQGYVGLVLNSGGPAAVVPIGGRDPILGTNPIAFGFPSKDGTPVLVDFATSKVVWGEIRQALLENRSLPPDSFLDSDGQVTRDPAAAEGVLPFNGAKGYALCCAIELMAALAPSAAVGLKAQTEYELGALFLAVSPAVFGGSYEGKVADLVDQLHRSRPIVDGKEVKAPGEQSAHRIELARQQGHVVVDDETFRQIQRMSKGLTTEMRIDDKTN